MKRAILRRSATVVAGATAIALIGATAALAFNSPGKPPGTGPQNIVWTGQGATSVSPNGTGACSASQQPNGQPANTPYLYWVLTTDGGSVSTQPTDPPPLPVLHLTVNGIPQPDVNFDSSSTSNSIKFITPYYTPDNTLGANADMYILSTGTGAWGLKISHGCAPPSAPPAAQAPTVTKNAAGAYTTTWTWGISKSVDQNQINAPPGGNATFNYTVVVTPTSSNGNVTVAGTIDINNPNNAPIAVGSIVDQLSNGVICQVTNPPAQLAPGDNPNIPYTCNLPDNAGLSNLTNTVTVSWPDQMVGGLHLAADSTDFTTGTIVFTQNQVNDCIDVTDSVAGDLGTVCAGGGPHTFTYSHTYSGDPAGTCTTHHNVASFTTTGPDSSTPPVTGSDSKDVQVCVGAPLTVAKTATPSLTRTYHWTIAKSVDQPVFNVPGTGQGGTGPASVTPNYTLTINHGAGVDSGWQVTGTITVSNPNDWEAVTLTDLKDAIDNGGTCEVDGSPGLVIPKNGSLTYNYTCTYYSPPSPSTFHNVATAKWDPAKAFTATGSATGEKDGDFANAVVTSVGDQASVTDTVGGTFGPFDVSMPDPIIVNYPHTFNAPSGTCTDYPNLATLTDSVGNTTSAGQNVHVCVGQDLSVTKTATPTLTNTYKWSAVKSVDNLALTGPQPGVFNYRVSVTHDGGTLGGWNVGGTIKVSNPNDWEDITIQPLQDVIQNEPNATCITSPAAGQQTIPAGGSQVFSYDCSYSQAPAADHQTNVATASWDHAVYATPSGSASGSADWLWSGQTPTVIDGSVNVFDSVDGGPAQLLGTANLSNANPTKVFTYSRQFNNDPGGQCTIHSNQASVTTNTLNVTTPSNTVNVTDCIALDLTAAKTANPSFDRTYLWSISKTETPPQINPGGTANYSVTVSQTGVKDGNWVVSGHITVSNPNQFEGIQLTNLTDKVNNGNANCVIGGPALPFTIPAATSPTTPGSQDFPYTCTYTAAPSPLAGTNTVTGTWTGGGTQHTSTQATANFDFGSTTPTKHNQTITPQDAFNGGAPVNLCTLDTTKPCTLTGSDTGPFPINTVYNYSRKIQPPTNGCQVFPNTATIKETGQSSSAKVTECSVGGLTMGFWHNMNGQGIITKSSGVGPWLYNTFGGANGPYAAMPGGASASGSQVAAYFLTVFSAANCSNNCTAMLRAQSFATALNVYFSDPGLGGNKIGAFNGNGTFQQPIGNMTIDTTAWKAAFNNQTSMTVLAMLQYVASQYNATTKVYYGGNQALTALAAEAFNAINNDQVKLV